MTAKSEISSGGISIAGLLGVLFVGLKLTGFIGWPWWLVTVPFWVGFAFVMVILRGAFVITLVMTARDR